jgi:hypothetical protein
MRHHQALFEKLQQCTAMFVPSETYDAVASFLLGYDAAYEGGLLLGFREWLALRLGTGSNLSWPALVLLAAFPGVDCPEEAVKRGATEDANAQRAAIDTLFTLVREFDAVVAQRDGLKNVLLAYREKFDAQDLG